MEKDLIDINSINRMEKNEFTSLICQFFNSPSNTLSFINKVEKNRPFTDSIELYIEIITQIKRLPYSSQIEILKNQDVLVSSKRDGENSYAKIEHNSSGLNDLSNEHYDRFKYLNVTYNSKFGFNFLCAVAGLDRNQILSIFEDRISNTLQNEFPIAIFQLEKLTFLRIKKKISFPILKEDYFPQYELI